MSMIEITNLTKMYGPVTAVDDISLSIGAGQIMGLLGPNGAGKSTTIKVLCSYIQATRGTITVKGHNVETEPLEVKKLIGYLPESAPLYGDMMVFDYLAYVAEIREVQDVGKRIRELANLCGLRTVMHKNINELSKGFKQRVGLAHAMMSNPEILLLDEPTSGLDPNQIIEIREIIKEIGSQKTIILSSHILSEIEATCNRVVIINKGKIAADGTTAQLKRDSGGESIINLEISGADFNTAKAALSQVTAVKEINQVQCKESGLTGLAMVTGSAEDVRPEVYRIIKNSDWNLFTMQKESRSLENVFQLLTKNV